MVSLQKKEEISRKCQPLIEDFKTTFIIPDPNKEFNYLVDIYTKWYRNYLYFCEKFKSEYPNRIQDEFEVKFVRLDFKGNNSFDFSYMRHTGKWHLVAIDLTLEDCLDMMLKNPNFQPIG